MSVVEEPRTKTSVAKVIEITSEPTESFEDAITKGILKAGETVTDIKAASVNGQQVKVEGGKVVGFRVDFKGHVRRALRTAQLLPVAWSGSNSAGRESAGINAARKRR